MDYTQEKKDMILKALDAHKIKRLCPECQGAIIPMELEDGESQLTGFNRNGKKLSTDQIDFAPMAVLTCSHCGYTKMFNLINLLGMDNALDK